MRAIQTQSLIALLAILGQFSGAGARAQTTAPMATQEGEEARQLILWAQLPSKEKEPAFFEPYLKEHPADWVHRQAALWWYGITERPDRERLKYHTLQMVEYHPSSENIEICNITAFYAEPRYMAEVIDRLEEQERRGHHEREFYNNLAEICEQAAVPPTDAAHKARFLRYNGLPANTVLRTTVDKRMADKAVGYFRKAIAAAKHDDFYYGFYSTHLATLLEQLGNVKEALAVFHDAKPYVNEIGRTNFLVDYGACLYRAGRLAEAKQILGTVRTSDHEGDMGGPGHATMEAEIELGYIALTERDTAAATRHLLASCAVEGCCHNNTKGLPLDLARALLRAGKAKAVAKFCETVLTKFTPGQPETKSLLNQARRTESRTQ